MIASCTSNSIRFGDKDKLATTVTVSKETVALVVVCTDLAAVFVLWFALLALKSFHRMVDADVNMGTLSATDFTVQVEQEPHFDHYNDLKGVYWAWAELVLESCG